MVNTAVMARLGGLLGMVPNYWVLLLGVLAGLYLVGLYQAETLVYVLDKAGFDKVSYNLNLLVEVFHDVRHAAGFMCH